MAEAVRRQGGVELRRVKQFEEETQRLSQAVADLTLDKAMLQDVLQKKGVRSARRREMVAPLVAAYRVRKRRALRLHRGLVPPAPTPFESRLPVAHRL